jgi:hypothetical protein
MTGMKTPRFLWDAVQAADRQFEIVGESLAQLCKVDPDIAATIPEFPRIRSSHAPSSRPSVPSS